MFKSIAIFFLGLILLSACDSKDDEKPALNFAIFFESICEETFSNLCVSAEEFRRIREIFEENENGAMLKCLPITVTDLDGIMHDGFLRGYSATDEDVPCVQEEDITF